MSTYDALLIIAKIVCNHRSIAGRPKGDWGSCNGCMVECSCGHTAEIVAQCPRTPGLLTIPFDRVGITGLLRNSDVVMASFAILLGTFNGARFLPSQLRSFENQTLSDWRLIASDDGSTDATLPMLSEFRAKHGPSKVEIRNGPARGFVANFLSLACDRSVAADYYAFSDQDDVWDPDKLSRALSWLKQVSPGVPALWCGRTWLIGEDGRSTGCSPLFKLKPSFRNALVQSIAGGNTMVFNAAAREQLVFCGDQVQVPSHDWWLYLITTAAGGVVRYDPIPTVHYREHPENIVGSNLGWGKRGRRLRMLMHGHFRHWTDLNIAALERFRPRMTPQNLLLFDLFCQSRTQNLLRRQIGFVRAGVYRQTLWGNLGLALAVWGNKI
jgi:glycosyltransferase involved in cell wall biosynthesis